MEKDEFLSANREYIESLTYGAKKMTPDEMASWIREEQDKLMKQDERVVPFTDEEIEWIIDELY